MDKKIQRAIDDIEKGQELVHDLNSKLDKRKGFAAEALKRKADDVRNLGQHADSKRFVAQEIMENKTYKNLEDVVKVDMNAAKQIKRQ